MGANVAPEPTVADIRGGRGLRILLVWGVRFTRECLAEILERDPLVSVVGSCADLSEAVALSPRFAGRPHTDGCENPRRGRLLGKLNARRRSEVAQRLRE